MSSILAQDVTDKALYLKFNGKELRYFSSECGADGNEPLDKRHVISLGSQFTNIYMNWLNPLKYQVKWKDTTYSDERDKMIRDFVEQMVGQFRMPPAQYVKPKEISAYKYPTAKFDDSEADILKKDGVFFNNDLNELRIIVELFKSKTQLTPDESTQISQIENVFTQLDSLDYYNAYPYSQAVKEVFNELFLIENAGRVTYVLDQQKNEINKLIGNLNAVKKNQENIPGLLDAATENINLTLSPYVKNIITNFLNDVKNNLVKNETLVSKTKPIFEEMENSIKDSSEQKGYFHIKDIKFDEGSVFETEITVAEYQFDPDAIELSKKKDIYQSKIIFQSYDWVHISVCTGLFYSNAAIKGFGVTPDGNGKFIVTEDTFTKNNSITGLFLNMYFDVDSRYFSPGIQFGIDPTKTHPYLLLGIGAAIPSTKFFITGGPVWAWSPRLEDLAVGGVVNSTTDLEKKIKYDINIVPNGWYLGVLYEL